jgi:hypothetical protein
VKPVRLFVLSAALLATACLTDPDTVFGTYTLRSHVIHGGVPYAYQDVIGAPGDSVRVTGGAFTIREDYRWTSELDYRLKRNGTWQAPIMRADSGSWTLVSGAGIDVTLSITSDVTNGQQGVPYEPIQINGGREFVSASNVYRR